MPKPRPRLVPCRSGMARISPAGSTDVFSRSDERVWTPAGRGWSPRITSWRDASGGGRSANEKWIDGQRLI